MSRKLLWLGGVLSLIFFALPGIVLADSPPMHQKIDEYTGPETCAKCHSDAGQEVFEGFSECLT